jgi:phenylalanyl-tRNA synthetase beta chain
MPTVNLNKEVFEKLVGKSLPLEELKDRISMLGTDLKSIEGNEIKVEVFPNRPDMLSEQGFARAFASFIGAKKGLRKYDVKKSEERLIVEDSVKEVRPFTACAIVRDIQFDDEKIKEIIQIQEKLHTTFGRNRNKVAIGIYPEEKIKYPIYFRAVDKNKLKFRPLESDKEMTGKEILETHPKGKEYASLLEGYDNYPVFMDDNKQVLSLTPIINSHLTGKIGESTKDVFIECSGHNFEACKICLNIIVTAMAEMNGQIYSMSLEYENKKHTSPDLSPSKMDLDLEYINKRLGLSLREKEISELLSKMGYGFEKGKVLVPAYRADIMHQVDLMEDVAIAYGFENFVPEIPNVMTVGKEDPFSIFSEKVTNILIGLGLLECYTYHLTSKEKQTKLMNLDNEVVEIANSVSAEQDCLRSWMVPCLMEVLSENKHHELPHRLFDIGVIFNPDKDKETETGVKEATRLGVVIAQEDADYTKVRQVLDYLLHHLGLKAEYNETEHDSFIPGRVARCFAKEKGVAYLGEIHPGVLNNWNLEVPVAVLELNLSDLFEVMDV